MTIILTVFVSIIAVLVLLFVIAMLVYWLMRRKKTDKAGPKIKNGSGLERWNKFKESLLKLVKNPSIFIVIVLVVVNGMIFSIDESFWRSLWSHQNRFWAINAGLFFTILFRVIKKDEKTPYPMAKPASNVMGLGVLILLIMEVGHYDFASGWRPSLNINQTSTVKKIEVPSGKIVETKTRNGYDFDWSDSQGAFTIENEKGGKGVFDPDNNIFKNLPFVNVGEKRGFSKVLKFKSLHDKPATVILKFTKQPIQ
jgi:hypothetical protein